MKNVENKANVSFNIKLRSICYLEKKLRLSYTVNFAFLRSGLLFFCFNYEANLDQRLFYKVLVSVNHLLCEHGSLRQVQYVVLCVVDLRASYVRWRVAMCRIEVRFCVSCYALQRRVLSGRIGF